MSQLAELWDEVLPDLKRAVTGVGVWAALNSCRPVTVEEDTLVIGLPHGSADLGGHLRLPQTRKLIETEMGRLLDQKLSLRVIEGTEADDWTTEKRRDAERRRLQEQALERARAQSKAGTSWEGVYDALSRRFAELPNRSLPQTKAKFFLDAVQIVADALRETPVTDDLAERNYARCLERVAQYAEIPSAIVAVAVLQKTFEG